MILLDLVKVAVVTKCSESTLILISMSKACKPHSRRDAVMHERAMNLRVDSEPVLARDVAGPAVAVSETIFGPIDGERVDGSGAQKSHRLERRSKRYRIAMPVNDEHLDRIDGDIVFAKLLAQRPACGGVVDQAMVEGGGEES